MPEDGDATEVEPVDGGQGGQMVGGPGGVLAGDRPPPAGADPAVLRVPGGDAPGGEVDREAVHEVAFPGVVPEPAVEQHHHRVGTGAGRRPEVALLAGVGAVGQRVGGLAQPAGQEEDGVAGGVGAAAVEQPGAGRLQAGRLGLGAGLAQVARFDGHDRDRQRADRLGQGGIGEPSGPRGDDGAGEAGVAAGAVGGQGPQHRHRIAGPFLHVDPELGRPLPALPPVEPGAGHRHDALGHGASAPGRRRARAMIVRWISDVPS